MIDHALNIVTTGSVFFTVAVGLLIILSIMGVVNLAHGAFMTVGAYAAVVVSDRGWDPWWSLLLAPAAGFVLGLLTERVLVRRLYRRPLDTILATWGLSIVLIQVLSDRFGRSSHFVDEIVSGDPIAFGDTYYSRYRAFIVVVAICVSFGLTLVLRYTNLGIIARAVILNPELARVLGINTRKVNAATFAFGSALAAFAGAVIVPMSSVDPNMGTPWVITAFMVVLAAGVSISALWISAIALAAAQVLTTYYIAPVIGSLVVIALPIVLMRFYPDGLAPLLKGR
jgi:branched-subunit amino acid ABC-type transport system permease component